MAWQTLLIQNEARLGVRQAQMVCRNADDELAVPLEDVAVVILDSPRVSVTSALMVRLVATGAAAVICDESHLPAGLLLPFHQHSRQTRVAELQLGWSAPFRKRCWQAVVRSKIANQARCLELAGATGAGRLGRLVKGVRSGDSGNIEARAAAFYWRQLMGSGFSRAFHRDSDPDRINSALNYGYAVVRAAVARSLVGHGLLPFRGLHHRSELNAFNLADDLLEPLRPMVDLEVHALAGGWPKKAEDGLSKDDRRALAGLGGSRVDMAGEVYTILRAADLMARFLVRAAGDRDPAGLVLPRFAENNGADGP